MNQIIWLWYGIGNTKVTKGVQNENRHNSKLLLDSIFQEQNNGYFREPDSNHIKLGVNMKRVTLNINGWIITLPVKEEDLAEIVRDFKDELVKVEDETREWVK